MSELTKADIRHLRWLNSLGNGAGRGTAARNRKLIRLGLITNAHRFNPEFFMITPEGRAVVGENES